jgi:vitamin B12 transporter
LQQRTRTWVVGLGIVACGLAAGPARGQEAPHEPEARGPGEPAGQPVLAEEILVLTRRFEAPAAHATPAVSLLGRADVERRQATHVHQLLTEVPGVHVLPDGPAGQFTRVFVRGAASNHTLVLVDGVPQNDATTGGGFDWNDLGTEAVERVEVLRGSYGVLYGSEALGGVVGVTTLRGHGPARAFVRLEGGSFDTHRETAGVAGSEGAADFALTLANFRTHGERRRESFRSGTVTGRFGLDVSPEVRVELSMRYADSRAQSPFDFPAFGSTVLPEDPNVSRTRTTFSSGTTLTWDPLAWLTVRAAGSVLDVDSRFRNGPDGPTLIDPDFTPGSGDEFTVVRDEFRSENEARDLRARLEATARLGTLWGLRDPADGGLALDLTAGGEYLDQRTRSVSTFPDFNAPTSTTQRLHRTTDTESLFAQAELRLPPAFALRDGVVAVGVRRDDHSVFGSESSPYVGARVAVDPTGTTLRSSYGEGFRAPKPVELFDPFVGNTGLGPEVSRSLDVGAVQPFLEDRVSLSATWFRLRTDDLVAFDPTDTAPAHPFGRLANFRRTETTGFEYALAAQLPEGFRLRGAYTHQNPRDRDSGRPLPARPRQFGSAGVAWESRGGAWLVSLDGFFSGSDPSDGLAVVTYPEGRVRRRPGRRQLVDLTVRYRASEALTFFGRVENLLDDDWVATPTAPAGPPLGVFVGLQLDL